MFKTIIIAFCLISLLFNFAAPKLSERNMQINTTFVTTQLALGLMYFPTCLTVTNTTNSTACTSLTANNTNGFTCCLFKGTNNVTKTLSGICLPVMTNNSASIQSQWVTVGIAQGSPDASFTCTSAKLGVIIVSFISLFLF